MASKDDQEGDLGGPREPTKGLWEAKRGPDPEKVDPGNIQGTHFWYSGEGVGEGVNPFPKEEGKREDSCRI